MSTSGRCSTASTSGLDLGVPHAIIAGITKQHSFHLTRCVFCSFTCEARTSILVRTPLSAVCMHPRRYEWCTAKHDGRIAYSGCRSYAPRAPPAIFPASPHRQDPKVFRNLPTLTRKALKCDSRSRCLLLAWDKVARAQRITAALFFLESTFIDQNNPKRQTAGPLWGSPKLDLVTAARFMACQCSSCW